VYFEQNLEDTRIRFFEETEYSGRIERVRAELRRRDLDGLLLFAQESLYYLAGYDTTGYVFFQSAVLTADGQPLALLTRRPDWPKPAIPRSSPTSGSGMTGRMPVPRRI
jgi:Xaa-Pro aminopeptidase